MEPAPQRLHGLHCHCIACACIGNALSIRGVLGHALVASFGVVGILLSKVRIVFVFRIEAAQGRYFIIIIINIGSLRLRL